MATVQTPVYPGLSQNTVGLLGWVRRHSLFTFFALAFGFTWPFMIADALGAYGVIPFRLALAGPGIVLVLLMGFGPTFAALIVTGATSGRAGIKALLRRLLLWRAGIQWYAAAILGTGVIFFAASRLYLAAGGALRAVPAGSVLELGLLWLVSFVLHGLLNGEELGWRGVALPALLAKYNALGASLILGVIWALFHLPLFFTPGGGVGGNQANTPMLAFLVIAVSSSILVTWLYNNTQGSVLFAYIFHAAVNTWPDLFHSAAADGVMDWFAAGLFALAAVSVVFLFGAAHLRREQPA
jgi:membrane protease YdiL (CAAX protease family)